MENSEQVLIEKVIPDDGRQETSWLLASVAIILCFAAVTLKYNQDLPLPDGKHLELGVTGKAVLTALRNAADEIMFMSDGEAFPEIRELEDSLLPPFKDQTETFAQYRWLKLSPECYYGKTIDGSAPEFILKLGSHAEIYWHSAGSQNVEGCTDLKGWQVSH